MLSSDQTYRAPPNSGKVVLGVTLPSLLDQACDRYPNSHALNQWTQTGWQPLSNQEFQIVTEEVALGLLDLELEKGDRVALLMHSDVNFCIADMGCLLGGLVNVPIDLSQTLENMILILQHAEAKALIISNLDLLYQVVPYLWDTPKLKTVIIADVPADWQQIHSQILTCQLDKGEAERENQNPVPSEACLCIPKFLLPANQEQPYPEFPQCIQVFSLAEIRARGQAHVSENKKQQLRSNLTANDLATIIYIPGVMGEPLGVMLTHENLSADAVAMFSGIPDLEFGNQEVIVSFLPLTHVFARVLLYGHLNYGHSVYLTTANRVIKHLREIKPTVFATVPLLLEKIHSKILEEGSKQAKAATVREVKHSFLPDVRALATQMIRRRREANTSTQKFRLSFWRSGAHLSPFQWQLPRLRMLVSPSQLRDLAFTQQIFSWALDLAKQYELGKPSRNALMLKLADRLVFWQWRNLFGGRVKYLICGGAALKAEIANLFGAAGVTILQGYGLTETSSAMTCNRGSFNRAGTVGVPLAGVEIAIASDGEILCKSPYTSQGYYKNLEATQQLIDADGWLHTGDLGEFTNEGFLKITGLKKNRFKLSTGKYVTPLPLETKLEQSPLVAKAVTVGSERKFCAMLIFPDLDNLHFHAQSIGINLPTQGLLKHSCIIAIYQALVDEANCHLPYWSTVKRFQLINATLTVENGLLTSTDQVNRAKVAETFAQEIDAIYEDSSKHRRDDAEIGNLDEQDIPLSACPIPQVSCPTFAQSLNT